MTHITDHVVLCLFHRLFLLIVAGCGKVFMIRKVEYEWFQVSGSLEDYNGWAWDACDIEGCSRDFPFVRTSYSNGIMVLDLLAAAGTEGYIRW